MISDHGRPETNKPGARLRLANLTLSDAGRDRDHGPGYMTFVTGRAIDRRARRQVLEFRILVPKPASSIGDAKFESATDIRSPAPHNCIAVVLREKIIPRGSCSLGGQRLAASYGIRRNGWNHLSRAVIGSRTSFLGLTRSRRPRGMPPPLWRKSN
jgi:hypothetical protein